MALRTPLSAQPHLYIGDSTGRPLDYGRVYFGEPNKDPEFYPIDIYLDPEMTIAAAQPVRTKGGFMDVGGNLAELHAAEVVYSLKVLDQYGRQVFYKPEMYRNNVSDFLVDEITRATAAENLIAGNLTAETQRAIAAEKVIADAVTTEKDRAIAAEGALGSKDIALQNQINSIGGGKFAYTTYAKMEAAAALPIGDPLKLPANSSVDVTNDADATKNGNYAYDGVTFTKSAYDPLSLAKADATTKVDAAKVEAKAYTDSQSARLFENLIDTKFPDANLIARRYLTTGESKDYAAGTYQTASPDGLAIAVTAAGSIATAHYFKTNLSGFNSVATEFEVTLLNSSQGDGFGVGYIDNAGQYIMYLYATSGTLRKVVNQSQVTEIAKGFATSGVGDKLKVEVKSDKVLFYKNNVLTYTHAINPIDSINGREIIFGQLGFSQYKVVMTAKSDPIREYVDNKIAQVVPDIPVANNPKTYYKFDKTGGATNSGLMTVYTKIKDDNYVGFDVAHIVDMSDVQYVDYWRIYKADFYTLIDGAMVATGKTALVGGESEFVWKQTANKVDFTGGYHGDELMTDIKFLANGLPVSLSVNIPLTACDSFEYIEKSTMHETANKDSDPFVAGHPIVANHVKNTSFYNGGYKTYNKIIFNYAGTMSTLYHGISCISKDVASTVIAGNDFASQAMTGGGLNYFEEAKARDYIGYNTANKLSVKATARIINDTTADLASTFFVHDRTTDSKYYRKSPPKNVVVGEVMESEFSCFFDKS